MSVQPLQVKSDPAVQSVFEGYPASVRDKLLNLRRLILETAKEIEGITFIEETLKWGEPSYLTTCGSTIRMDWKAKNPQEYAMYFKCTSKLLPAFRLAYADLFKFEGNRAIVFGIDDAIPEPPLKKCIAAALTYHKVKHLSMLGM